MELLHAIAFVYKTGQSIIADYEEDGVWALQQEVGAHRIAVVLKMNMLLPFLITNSLQLVAGHELKKFIYI